MGHRLQQEKNEEGFFTAWRRIPTNGMRRKASRHFIQNDAGLQDFGGFRIERASAGLKSGTPEASLG